MPGLSGVGISFGADRIYDVLDQLNLYPEAAAGGSQVLFINFGPAEAACCLRLAAQVRRAGISAEVYPDSVKMKKQMQYANATHVQHVALVGEEEMKQGLVTLKNMTTGQQQQLTPEQLVAALQQA